MPNRYAEHEEQVKFFRKLATVPYQGETLRDYCWAVPNGGTAGGRRALLAGVRRKAEGVTSGVSDVECMIAVPPYTGWHCEMKRADGKPSDVSDSQKKFMDLATACGRKCDLGFGAEDAWKKLMIYLQGIHS